MLDHSHAVPRRLWILWFQGLPSAPFLVRRCVRSWIELNPTWDIVVLDSSNLHRHVSLEIPDRIMRKLSLAHQSDLVRLALLARYGGVWADATTICRRPLDDWIDDCGRSGFFAFRKPGRDRIMSNWFMASESGCALVAKLGERLTAFFTDNDFQAPNRLQTKAKNALTRLLCRSHRTTRFWFSPIITKGVRVYPYFVFHYMFERLVATDVECQRIWNDTTKVAATGPLGLGRSGLYASLTDSIRRELDEGQVPLYKLTWKYERSRCLPSTWLYHLLHARVTGQHPADPSGTAFLSDSTTECLASGTDP
jgi:hypothetical protein